MSSAKYHVGSLTLTVLSDGVMWLDGGAVFGPVPKILWSRVVPEINDRNEIPLGLNCLLLESDGKTVLIETGLGDKTIDVLRKRGAPVEHGRLLDDLAANGVQPDDIDIVVNTHLHNDHCGWNTRREGEALTPTFANARYYIQRAAWEAATHPNERTKGAYLSENLLPLEEAGLVEFLDGETQITPDVRVIESPGHTADHASVVISRGGEMAVYLGDVAHQFVQLERVAWLCAFDDLPLVSMETKRQIVSEAVAQEQLLIYAHHTYPGVARLKATEGKVKAVAEASQVF